MRFGDWEKEAFSNYVAVHFQRLAEKLGSEGKGASVAKAFNENIAPRLLKMQEADPDFFGRLPKANYIVTEGNVKWPSNHEFPHIWGITSDNGGQWDKSSFKPIITRKMILDGLTGEAKTNAEKANQLQANAERVKTLVKEYLNPFEKPAQISFSFPQLATMYNMHKGNQVRPQKRPRIFHKPSDELKTLVTQALMLAQVAK